jgi:hypothetical protein
MSNWVNLTPEDFQDETGGEESPPFTLCYSYWVGPSRIGDGTIKWAYHTPSYFKIEAGFTPTDIQIEDMERILVAFIGKIEDQILGTAGNSQAQADDYCRPHISMANHELPQGRPFAVGSQVERLLNQYARPLNSVGDHYTEAIYRHSDWARDSLAQPDRYNLIKDSMIQATDLAQLLSAGYAHRHTSETEVCALPTRDEEDASRLEKVLSHFDLGVSGEEESEFVAAIWDHDEGMQDVASLIDVLEDLTDPARDSRKGAISSDLWMDVSEKSRQLVKEHVVQSHFGELYNALMASSIFDAAWKEQVPQLAQELTSHPAWDDTLHLDGGIHTMEEVDADDECERIIKLVGGGD